MGVRRLTALTAVLLAGAGLALTGWGPLLIPAFGIGHLPVPDPDASATMEMWRLAAFVRVLGVALLASGAVLWAVRDAVAAAGTRRFAATMAAATLFAALVVLAQQVALWTGLAGTAAAIALAVPGLGWTWVALRMPPLHPAS